MHSSFWSESLRHLTPYTPGEQLNAPGLIKLNTNENPYPPSPRVLLALQRAANDDLRRYPDPESLALKQLIADQQGLTPDHVFVGNGSDEVLAHAFLGLLRHTLPVRFPDVSYSFYPVYCRLYGIAFESPPVAEDWSVQISDYLTPCGGVVLPNPNAPTGRALPLSDLRTLAEQQRHAVIIIDEAYVDFGAESAVSLVHEHPHVLVVQTLSKSRSLAGLRVGWALGHPDLIAALRVVKGSFNSYPLDRLAQAGAEAALSDTAYFEATRQAVIAGRNALADALPPLGFKVCPSAANFLWVRPPDGDAAGLYTWLKERHILVRHFDFPRQNQQLRITVGAPAECEALLTALRERFAGENRLK